MRPRSILVSWSVTTHRHCCYQPCCLALWGNQQHAASVNSGHGYVKTYLANMFPSLNLNIYSFRNMSKGTLSEQSFFGVLAFPSPFSDATLHNTHKTQGDRKPASEALCCTAVGFECSLCLDQSGGKFCHGLGGGASFIPIIVAQ